MPPAHDSLNLTPLPPPTAHCFSSQKSSIAIAIAMAAAVAANVSSSIIKCPNFQHLNSFRFSRQIPNYRNPISSSILQKNNHHLLSLITLRTTKKISIINCSATNKPSSSSSSSTEISSTAKIRSEVLSPFRTVRMFFYLAFIASGSLGGLIATTKLIGALSRSGDVVEILSGLGIDLGAVAIFAFLYSRDNNARNAQLARLSREENLSNLKLRVNESKVIPVSALRGYARLVVVAGPGSYIMESFKRSLPFSDRLIERGVLVVPFATDGDLPQFEFEENDEIDVEKRKRLWQLVPVIAADWSGWLEDQKKLAKVSPDSPVYISLRLDGRVRGSGIGYPPWNAFVAQLPPVKGLWLGLLDGMDGRV